MVENSSMPDGSYFEHLLSNADYNHYTMPIFERDILNSRFSLNAHVSAFVYLLKMLSFRCSRDMRANDNCKQRRIIIRSAWIVVGRGRGEDLNREGRKGTVAESEERNIERESKSKREREGIWGFEFKIKKQMKERGKREQ